MKTFALRLRQPIEKICDDLYPSDARVGECAENAMTARLLSLMSVLASLSYGELHAQDVASCRGVADSMQRLTCYDSIPLPSSAPLSLDAAFEKFRELVTYAPVATATGPYAAEVEWRFSAGARQWLVTSYDEFVRRDISLMQEGVELGNCNLQLYQTWRVRGGYGTYGRSPLETDDTARQGLLARTYFIALSDVDTEATRAAGAGRVVMQRDAEVVFSEGVRIGWTDNRSLFPYFMDVPGFPSPSLDWSWVHAEEARTMDVRMGAAYPEDAARAHGAFLELAQACQS